MKTKLTLAAAAALVVGVAGLAIMATASNAAPIIKIKLSCWLGFTMSSADAFYKCAKTFHAVCKPTHAANTPIVVHLGGNQYRVEYGCSPKLT